MGEQETETKPDSDLRHFPISSEPHVQQKWLDNLDDLIALKSDCPYSPQTYIQSKEVREIVDILIECEMTQNVLDQVPPGYEQVQEDHMKSQKEVRDRREKAISRLLARHPNLESAASKLLSWQKQDMKDRKEKFALKYDQKTFYYSKTSCDLPEDRSFSILCGVFYGSCPNSGKMPWKKVVVLMKEKGEKRTLDREQIRQLIRGFNRWIRGRRFGFGDRISGDVLKLAGEDIVRLK